MTIKLKPFFYYYGAKFNLAKYYPIPKYDTIVEPFAGSAAYSCLYPKRRVILYDLFDDICSLWKYLINVKEEEIKSLPLVKPGQLIESLNVCKEAQLLIAYWAAFSNVYAPKKMSMTVHKYQQLKPSKVYRWGEAVKQRIIKQLPYIRHWKIKKGCYSDIENIECTWFIDPPYQVKGYKYAKNKIDYINLAAFTRERKGQVIACEQEGAEWLPFKPFRALKNNKNQKTYEAVYLQNCDEQLNIFDM
jgi:site-specific DNA-adenine methylase